MLLTLPRARLITAMQGNQTAVFIVKCVWADQLLMSGSGSAIAARNPH